MASELKRFMIVRTTQETQVVEGRDPGHALENSQGFIHDNSWEEQLPFYTVQELTE
jgi:hypothetical protein